MIFISLSISYIYFSSLLNKLFISADFISSFLLTIFILDFLFIKKSKDNMKEFYDINSVLYLVLKYGFLTLSNRSL